MCLLSVYIITSYLGALVETAKECADKWTTFAAKKPTELD